MPVAERKLNLKAGAWYFLSIAILAICIASRYFKYMQIDGDWLTVIYLFAATVSHFVLLSMIVYAVLFIPLIFFIRNKNILHWYVALISTLTLLLLLLDTYVFDLYRFHINEFVLNLVFGGAFSEIFVLDTILYIKAITAFIVTLMLLYLLARFIWRITEKGVLKHGKVIAYLMVALFLFTQFTHVWASAVSYRTIQQSSLYYPLFFPLKANKLLAKMGVKSNDRYKDINMDELDDNTLNYPLAKLEFQNTDSVHLNILWILIDAWQYETFTKEISPNIYSFAQDKITFDRHYSGSNGTRGGIFSLFYSLPSLYWNDFLYSRTAPVFMDVLKKFKYTHAIYASAPLTSPEFDKTVFAGMKDVRLKTPGNKFYERDIQITKDFCNWIDTSTTGNPFFGFLFYDTPHNYNIPPQFPHPFKPYWDVIDFSKLSNDCDPTEFYNSYKNTVWFTDSLIGQVLDRLKEKNLTENTVIIISSDHGQEFNENKKNYWGHTSNFSKYQLQVPFIISWPGKQPAHIKKFTSHYDVVPTLLHDIFHCTTSSDKFSFGTDLFDTVPPKSFIAGSREHFAVIDLENNRINTVFFNGTISVTDMKLNELREKPKGQLMNNALLELKKFYRN